MKLLVFNIRLEWKIFLYSWSCDPCSTSSYITYSFFCISYLTFSFISPPVLSPLIMPRLITCGHNCHDPDQDKTRIKAPTRHIHIYITYVLLYLTYPFLILYVGLIMGPYFMLKNIDVIPLKIFWNLDALLPTVRIARGLPPMKNISNLHLG